MKKIACIIAVCLTSAIVVQGCGQNASDEAAPTKPLPKGAVATPNSSSTQAVPVEK